jgi:ribosomal protein S11
MLFILLISLKIFKGLKKFLRKFLEIGLKITFIFLIYKFAHNGCRKKNMKRR